LPSVVAVFGARVRLSVVAGRPPIGALIGERYPPESINDAVADVTGGGVGRAIVLPKGERRLRP
jgi:hypothetical protein